MTGMTGSVYSGVIYEIYDMLKADMNLIGWNMEDHLWVEVGGSKQIWESKPEFVFYIPGFPFTSSQATSIKNLHPAT